MKLRLGFVSNSSSVSFCIYGVCLDNYVERDKKLIKKVDNGEVSLSGLSQEYNQEGDSMYIGRELKIMKEDETLGQFKKDTEKMIQDIFKDDSLKYSVYEEGYYNG